MIEKEPCQHKDQELVNNEWWCNDCDELINIEPTDTDESDEYREQFD